MQSVIRSDEGRSDEVGGPIRPNAGWHLSRTAAQIELTSRLRRLSTALESARYIEPHTIPGIETSLRRACLAVADGRLDDGYGLLIQSLRIGATRGLRMIFVDSGRPLVTLLQNIYAALATTDSRLAQLRPYIATVLRFAVPLGSDEPDPPTYRALSRRETAILEMITRGMSNKHIAQALGITPETVKSHAKSIFVKLDTRTRAQAVARAESIGLL